MVAIAIFALVLALVLPSVTTARAKSQERAEVQRLMGELRRARALAVSGEETAPGVRAESAGITFISPTQYITFTDTDSLVGGEFTQAAADLGETRMTFQLPGIGAQIRFRRNGTRLPTSPPRIELLSTTGRVYTIDINLAGLTTLD